MYILKKIWYYKKKLWKPCIQYNLDISIENSSHLLFLDYQLPQEAYFFSVNLKLFPDYYYKKWRICI